MKIKKISHWTQQKEKGFSLIELTVGLSLLVIIIAAVVLTPDRFKSVREVELTVNELVAALHDTQRRSLAGEGAGSWGIKFINEDTGEQRYDIFKGQSYDSATVITSVYLNSGLMFGTPGTSSTVEVMFNGINASPGGRKVITILPRNRDPFVGVVTVDTIGKITGSFEEGLFGYWSFDEGVGSSARDTSGVNEYATTSGTISWLSESSCKRGGCINFNNTYFLSGALLDRTLEKFTIEAWVNHTGDGNSGGLWSGLTGSSDSLIDAMFQGASRKPKIRTDAGGEFSANSQPGYNVWVHLAYTYDGSKTRIFSNGVELGSTNLTNASFDIDTFNIGRSEGQSTQLIYAIVDELKVYEKALSTTTIKAHYNELQ